MRTTRRNVLTGGGKAVAAAAVLPMIAGVAGDAVAAPADDMRLLEMWRRAKAFEAKVNDPAAPEDESDRCYERFAELREAIIATPAATPLVIATKLQIAVDMEDLAKDVVEHPSLVMPRAIVTALADAERLAGGVV